MSLSPRLLFASLTAAMLAISTLAHTARADDAVNEAIREQQRIECERQGGRYDYSKCYLPDRSSQSSSSSSSCGFWCKAATAVVVGGAVIVGRAAYCEANPGKC